MNELNKIVFLLIATTILSCGNKEFRALQINLKEQGNENCKNHLQSTYKSIYYLIQHKESIMLLKHSEYWSEIDKNKINRKHRIPNRYSHQYKLTNSKWLNYRFSLISNKAAKCITNLDYYNSVSEKLEIYGELLIDAEKIQFIEAVGESKFNNNYYLTIFGPDDLAENFTIVENRVSVPKSALDWRFYNYAFLLVSVDKNIEPLIYYNNAILIDLNNEEILYELKPIF